MPNTRPIIAVDMDEVIADALAEALLRYNLDCPPNDPTDPPIARIHLHGRTLWDAVPTHRLSDIERFMLSEDFFRVLPVMPHAQRVLAALQSRYDIYIASAAMEIPSSFTPKYHWLREHFPFIPPSNIVFCGNKSILRADYLIDDNPRQLRLFQESAPPQTPSADPDPTQDLSSRPETAHSPSNLSSRPERSAVERSLHLGPETPPAQPHPTTTPTREGILFTSPANMHITGFRRVDNWLDVEAMFLP